MYLTNSSLSYIDAAISDPHYKGRDRYIIGVMIIKELLRKAASLGYKQVETTTFSKGLIKRYETASEILNTELANGIINEEIK